MAGFASITQVPSGDSIFTRITFKIPRGDQTIFTAKLITHPRESRLHETTSVDRQVAGATATVAAQTVSM